MEKNSFVPRGPRKEVIITLQPSAEKEAYGEKKYIDEMDDDFKNNNEKYSTYLGFMMVVVVFLIFTLLVIYFMVQTLENIEEGENFDTLEITSAR